MGLINFTLTTPKIEPGVLLSCLETGIPEIKIAQAIRESNSEQKRIRIGRSNPRVVKKPRSKFNSRKTFHRGQGTKLQRLNFRLYRAA